jgi:hypothetical protein
MGKRELLIAAAFIVIAAITYQFTAPPPKEGERGFSLRRIFSNMRREMRSDSARAEFTVTGTVPVAAGVETLRLGGLQGMPVRIEGEDRKDIAYEMPVRSTGPDPAAALEYAKKSRVVTDDLGSEVTLSLYFPAEGSQTAALTLKVPSRLAVRLEGVSRPHVRGVAALHLGRVSGEMVAEDIKGGLTGTHLNGDLTVNGAGVVDVILIGSRSRFEGIERGLTLNARSGECEILKSHGPLDFASTSARLMVSNHDGPITIGGDGGDMRIDRPEKAVKIDIRRAAIDLTLAAAVPVTVLTTEEAIRLVLDGSLAVEVDAVVTNSIIDASDFGLQPEKVDRGARLVHAFGGKAARVVLRSAGGDIVLSRMK